MPNKIEKLPDGTIDVELETGEKFHGDPLAVTEELAKAQVNTKRWGQGFKQENETLKAQASQQTATQSDNRTSTDANEAQLQAYLLNQTAKSLGFKDGEEYKSALTRVKETTDKVNNQLVATEFLSLNQDFPNTPEAVDALSKKIDEMKWDFTPQSMTAAHALLVREHAADPKKGYAALSMDDINFAANETAKQRQSAPPQLRSSSPDSRQQGNDPWAMKIDELRNAAIRQELEQK